MQLQVGDELMISNKTCENQSGARRKVWGKQCIQITDKFKLEDLSESFKI